MLITSLALLLLNYFSAKTTRELMFRAKYASAQDKIQVVASAFSGVDPLTPESAEQVISVLCNINAARLIVTNAEGTAVYDSSENQNAIGQRVLLPAVVEALRGSDVFHSAYQDDALVSSAAVPIMDHDSPNGCVYLMDYDAEQYHCKPRAHDPAGFLRAPRRDHPVFRILRDDQLAPHA